MKFLLEQTACAFDQSIQERIKLFEKSPLLDDKDTSSSIESLKSVLANTLTHDGSSSIITKDFLNKFDKFSNDHGVCSSNKNQSNSYCSSVPKRIEAHSLSNHSTMAITAITSFSEEQTNSFDYDNTYILPDEMNILDDVSSLTSITSNLHKEFNAKELDTSIYADLSLFHSDTEDISLSITLDGEKSPDNYIDLNTQVRVDNLPSSTIQNRIHNNENETNMSVDSNKIQDNENFTGLVYATKCIIIQEQDNSDVQTLSEYDNLNSSSQQNNPIRSNIDTGSLNSSMTSTTQDDHCPMIFIGQQLGKQQEERTNEQQENKHVDDDVINNDVSNVDDDDDSYSIVDQQKSSDQLTIMNKEGEIEVGDDHGDDDGGDEQYESTRMFDNGEHEGFVSDESQYSDELRYSSEAIRNSCANDDLNNASSTLREEAISIAKVRCKQRQHWIHTQTLIDNNTFNDPVDGTNTHSSCLNKNVNSTTRVQTATTMLLQKNSAGCNKNETKNGETISYGLLQVDPDHRSIKTDKSIVSSLSKTSNTSDKDAPPTNKKANSFYLIHHQSSLIPIQDLLNKNTNTNIEIIQMDEQECILEIVDGVLTLVPKDKSASSTSNSYEEKSVEKRKNSVEHQTNNSDSPKSDQRSSSIASSISTPPLSDHEEDDDEQERNDNVGSSSRLSWTKENDAQGPFILIRDIPPPTSSPLPSQSEQSADLLDLFSTPLVPLSNSNTQSKEKHMKNLLEDSLSSVSSYEQNKSNNNDDNVHSSSSDSVEPKKERLSSPIQKVTNSSASSSLKDDISPVSSPNKDSTLNPIVPTSEKPTEAEKTEVDYLIPKTEPPPAAKPINKARINEFASLLSSSVHLTPPQIVKKQETTKVAAASSRPPPTPASPSRSEDHSFSSVPSANSDREERESYHTVNSNNNSEQEQIKRHIDARYNEKVDDRTSIQINTSNIKALFEQKISDTNKALAQSSEHLLHLNEARQQHKKVPVSYGSLKRNLPVSPQPTNNTRRQSYQDSSNMNKLTDHIVGTKDVVIEDKQPEHVHQTQHYASNPRRSNTEQIVRPTIDSLTSSPVAVTNGYYAETLLAREIRETQEKEEELRRQRRKCGLAEDFPCLLTIANNDTMKSDGTTRQPVKSTSFLSNLDFFTSKASSSSNEQLPPSPRRSTLTIQNIVYDSNGLPASEERKTNMNVVSQELSRFNNNGVPIIRTGSTANAIHRSASNQNILSAHSTANIVQREIEAIRAKEAELRQLGRIQHTSDEHSDPRKYQEYVAPLSKSQSSNTLSTGKVRRDSGRSNAPMLATSNGILKTKPVNNSSPATSSRGKFPSPNPTAPVVTSSNRSIDYSKLSTTDRLELEKRECEERERELRKQRNSLSGATPFTSTVNNVLQDELDDDQEGYFDKMERFKRAENEKSQAPLIRPGKKTDLSQKWEQQIAANRSFQNITGDNSD